MRFVMSKIGVETGVDIGVENGVDFLRAEFFLICAPEIFHAVFHFGQPQDCDLSAATLLPDKIVTTWARNCDHRFL